MLRPPVVHLYVCGAQCALRHEYSWSTCSGLLWLWLCCRPYKPCSDLNGQPKRQGDLDLWYFDLESDARVTCVVGYLVPILVFLCLAVRDRRLTDVRQKHRLMPPPIRRGGIIKLVGAYSNMSDLWRSHGRMFAHCHHWTCCYFSFCLWVVILRPANVS